MYRDWQVHLMFPSISWPRSYSAVYKYETQAIGPKRRSFALEITIFISEITETGNGTETTMAPRHTAGTERKQSLTTQQHHRTQKGQHLAARAP